MLTFIRTLWRWVSGLRVRARGDPATVPRPFGRARAPNRRARAPTTVARALAALYRRARAHALERRAAWCPNAPNHTPRTPRAGRARPEMGARCRATVAGPHAAIQRAMRTNAQVGGTRAAPTWAELANVTDPTRGHRTVGHGISQQGGCSESATVRRRNSRMSNYRTAYVMPWGGPICYVKAVSTRACARVRVCVRVYA